MYISLEERIYGLSTLWKEAAYNFAYWDELPSLNWDETYRKFLPRVIAAKDPLSYYAELLKFIALLKDGHTYVKLPEEIKPPYCVPFRTTYLEKKHVLCSLPKSSSIPLYSEILSINGIETEEYIRRHAYPYIWHERPDSQFFFGLLGYVISCKEKKDIRIQTNRGEFVCSKGLDAEMTDQVYPTHPKLKDAVRIYSSEVLKIFMIEGDIAYLVLPTFQSAALIDELYHNILSCKNCKGFLIDVRGNTGGSSNYGNAVARLFFQEAFSDGRYQSPVYIPAYAAYGKYRNIAEMNLEDKWEKKIYDVCTHRLFEEQNDWNEPDESCPICLSQPVVNLSDCTTASAAESFLATMKCRERATIVGTRSCGSNGQPFIGNLPGGGSFAINTLKCCTLDGVNYHNTGIQPDIFVENSIDDYRNNFDRTFDVGLHHLETLVE